MDVVSNDQHRPRPEDGEIDEVQADPYFDVTAEMLDTDDAPMNFAGAPEVFVQEYDPRQRRP